MKVRNRNLPFNTEPLAIAALRWELRRDNHAVQRIKRRWKVSDPLAEIIAGLAKLGPRGDRR